MPNLRDRLSQVSFVTGSANNPFEAASDPFSGSGFTVPALKIGTSGDRPTDEAQTSETLDAREVASGHDGSVSYFIRDRDADGTLLSSLRTAEVETNPVWARETHKPQDSSGTEPAEVFGGQSGATVTVGRASENGFKGTVVTLSATAAVPGEILQDEPSYA